MWHLPSNSFVTALILRCHHCLACVYQHCQIDFLHLYCWMPSQSHGMCASFITSNSTLNPREKRSWQSERRAGERENRMKGRRKAGEPKINHHPPHLPPPSTPPSHRKRGKNLWTPVGIASTTQAYSYANFAVSVSTVAVLTGGAVVRRPSSLPHHLFKSSKQKPGERATWLVKYACVGPLQWNNDCGITPACARGCVAISRQHWVNVRDVYSWGRERKRVRKRGVIKEWRGGGRHWYYSCVSCLCLYELRL